MSDVRTHRVIFYLNDDEQAGLEEAVINSGMERADYLRQLLRSDQRGTGEGTGEGTPETVQVLKEALADTRQSKDRLEQLLLQSQATVQNLTLALPAAGETSRTWWKVW